MRYNKVFFILKLFVSLLSLFLLFYNIGFTRVFSLLYETKISLILLSLLFYTVVLLLGAFGLYIFFRALNVKPSFFSFFGKYALGWSYASFTPAKLGEFGLMYLLKKYTTYGQSLAILLLEKLISFFSYGLLSVIGLVWLVNRNAALIVSIFMILVLSLIAVSFSLTLRNFVKKYILRKYAEKFRLFHQTFFSLLRNHRSSLLLNVFLSFLKLFLHSVLVYLLFSSAGFFVPIPKIMVIMAIVSVISFIPISLAGLGIKEASFVVLFTTFASVGEPDAFAISLLFLFTRYFISICFLIFSKHQPLPLQETVTNS